MDQEFEIEGQPELESYLKRNFNALKEQQISIRKQAIMNIYEKLKDLKFEISGSISQQILEKFTKDLLKAMSDSVEKVREYAIMSLKELLSRCTDMDNVLPYIFAVLSERTNCHDLDGILHLPEVMRPPPDQKPKVLVQVIEPSEELRFQLVELLQIILSCNTSDILREYLDDAVNCLRALCMDQYSEVQKIACQCLSEFCRSNHEILLHFTEPLARALLFPIISKKSKVRIAALEAMGSVLQCGIWKHNAIVFEILTGFRDPNSVPIKAFYEPIHNINYLASLITDPNPSVREMFISCVGDWLTRLEDRWDHHARLMPYIVSGLFDDCEDIQEIAQETIEQVGLQWEIEREKDIKEARQLGVDAPWTANGKLINLPLPAPFNKRPRLGARGFVRSQVRKMWGAMYRELSDFNEQNQLKAANLMLMGIIYSEDYMTQFLDQFIPNTINAIIAKEKDSKLAIKTASKVQESYRLLGRYCDYKSYTPLIFSSIRGQFKRDERYMKCSMEALNQLLTGALEATVDNEGLGEKINFIEQIIDLLCEENQIEFISTVNIEQSEKLLSTIINDFIKHGKEEEYKGFFQRKSQCFLNLLAYSSTILLNLPYDNQCLNQTLSQLKSNQAIQLRKQVEKYFSPNIESQERSRLLEEQIDNVAFLNALWKNQISELTINLLENKNLSFNSVKKIIQQLQLLEVSDFFIKLVYTLFSYYDDKIPQEVFSILIQFLGFSLEWLSKQSQQYAKNMVNLQFQQINKTILLICQKDKFSDKWKKLKNDSGVLEQFTNLFLSIGVLQRKLFKTQQNEIINIIHLLIIRLLPYPNAKSLQYNEKYLLPQLYEYIIDQIAILGDTPKQETKIKLLELLKIFTQYVPNSLETSFYQGESHLIEDYKKFLSYVIKLTIDEKDLLSKEKYIEILQGLKQKTPYNFYVELEQARYSKQLSRVDLLQRFV